MMDRLRSEKANKRFDTLKRFMDVWRLKVGNDLYPLIRLLLPDVSAKAPALLTTFSETAKGPSTTSRNK
jgi:DNA ligase-4